MKITESFKSTFDRGWGFLMQVIEVCPDDLWVKKSGGYFFWQQLFHHFALMDFFIMPKDGVIENYNVVMLKTEPQFTMSKEEVKNFAAKMKEKTDKWIDSLDDESLLPVHEGLSARRGYTVTYATALSALIAHIYYHIGACDSILRENGLKGVW